MGVKMTKFFRNSLFITLIMAAMLLLVSVAFAEDSKVPQRSDIEDKYKWKIEDIYENIDAWEADFEKLKDGTGQFEQYKGRLGESAQVLMDALKLSDELGIIEGNLYVYAYLKLDEDTRQSQYQEYGGRISALSSKLSEATSFMQPEILNIPKDKLDAFMAENKNLNIYRFFIDDMFRQQEHVLSEKEEAILAAAQPLMRTSSKVFNMIDNADHKLGTIVDSEGDKIELTRGRYYKILKGNDRELRRVANDTVQTSWVKYMNSIGATLGSSVEKDYFISKVRGYKSTLDRVLDGDNIPTSVFTNLVQAVNDNLHILHKLTSLRKKFLGVDTLYTYDLSVPMVKDFKKDVPYEEAVATLLEGLKPLGEKYIKDLKNGLESGWVDVYETEGKGSGAYSWGTYTSHPYVLMNYNDDMNSMFTLAHEMGHAMNSFYSNQYEPYIYHGHSLFTAEVASTCNEALLMKYLLEHTTDKQEKLYLLDYYIKQIDGTFFTQVMFSEFEMAIHTHLQNGGAFSVDFFRSTYREIFQKYFGPELVIGENNDLSGMKISHFYRAFYVYKYATSYAAAQMLSQKILEGNEDDLNAYLNFLSTGTSKFPVDILKDAGVDTTTPESVEATIKLFGELVDQMEQILLEG